MEPTFFILINPKKVKNKYNYYKDPCDNMIHIENKDE